MRITIFGASGHVGQLVVNRALKEGYEVTAFIHRRNPFTNLTHLTIAAGDVTDTQAVTRALQGSQAVISTLGSWHTKDKSTLTKGMETIIPIIETLRIQRLITVTGASAFYANDSLTTIDKFNHAIFKVFAPKILSDGEEHIRLLAASSLSWTTVRSPIMTKGRISTYALSAHLPSIFASIPSTAVARCLVDELSNLDNVHQAPVISRTKQ